MADIMPLTINRIDFYGDALEALATPDGKVWIDCGDPAVSFPPDEVIRILDGKERKLMDYLDRKDWVSKENRPAFYRALTVARDMLIDAGLLPHDCAEGLGYVKRLAVAAKLKEARRARLASLPQQRDLFS